MGISGLTGYRSEDGQWLRREILGLGATLVGFADMSPERSLPYAGLTRAISIAVQLTPEIIEAVRQGPTAEYAVEYERVNARLNQIASTTCARVQALGHRAESFPATIHGALLEDPAYQRDLCVAFQHKTAATRAGLGWIGKAAILVTPEHGPRVRLVTVFTDMPLQTGEPITRCRCGDCTECVEACPGSVIRGQSWEVGMPREALIDVHLCHAASHRVTLQHAGQQGPCGICVAVCPWGRS